MRFLKFLIHGSTCTPNGVVRYLFASTKRSFSARALCAYLLRSVWRRRRFDPAAASSRNETPPYSRSSLPDCVFRRKRRSIPADGSYVKSVHRGTHAEKHFRCALLAPERAHQSPDVTFLGKKNSNVIARVYGQSGPHLQISCDFYRYLKMCSEYGICLIWF